MHILYRENEAETNEKVANLVLLLLGFILLCGVFCWLGIFDIKGRLINTLILSSMIPLLFPVFLVRILHLHKEWVKYVIIICITVITGIAYSIFTFQSLLIFLAPSVIATFYLDRRVIRFSGVMTIVAILSSHLVTSFYLYQPHLEPFWDLRSIMIYGALPRIMQYLCILVMLDYLCKRFLSFLNGYDQVVKELKDHANTETSKEEQEQETQAELEHILSGLTQREKEVFALLAQGNTNVQIASKLSLSNGTVKNYVSNIYDKMNLHERTTFVLKYGHYYS